MYGTNKAPFDHIRLIWAACILALAAAATYLLILLHVLAVGDLKPHEEQASTIIIAAVSYTLGGLLFLLRDRWLWIVGAVLNALVIIFFYRIYQDRPAVLLSSGGLISTVTQVLLEVTLIYLLTSDWLRSRRSSS